MTGWWQRWRRTRTLERRAIPDELWQLTLVRFPFLAAQICERAIFRKSADIGRKDDQYTLLDVEML